MRTGLTIKSQPLPLAADATGTVRVGSTRIALEVVVAAYLEGASAEELVEQFPTLELGDVYSVLAFYLHNRDSVEAYLAARRTQADELKSQVRSNTTETDIRRRLLARQTRRDD